MLKFGTDPEYFSTVNINNKNFVVSPALLEEAGIIKPVIKDELEKHPVYINKKDFSWMMDGVAWELTVKKPLLNASQIKEVLDNSLNCLEEYLSKLDFNGLELNLYKKPVVDIKPDWYIEKLHINKIFQGFIFGCDKDYDAIETEYNCKTMDVSKHLFRYGGGHIHVSGDENLYEYIIPAIKLMAITVGNFVIANSIYPELDRQRGQTYGKPARFRPQIYKNGDKGLEYRTPSNSWTSFSKEKIEEMLYLIDKAVYFLNNPELGIKIIDNYLPSTINSIVNVDLDTSKNILKEIS